MHLHKLQAINFKSFRNVTIHFDDKLNVFTGVNNSGKTTILEAIALWLECFRKIIHPAGRSVGKYNVNKGEYRFKHSNAYFPFDEIVSVRSPYYSSIFHGQNIFNEIKLIATFLNEQNDELEIGFAIKKKEGNVYDIYLDGNKDFDYVKFNNYFDKKHFPSPINLIFASPIAFISSEELFVTQPQLADKLLSRTSHTVIRNRIYNLTFDTILFERFKETLSNVITGRSQGIDFRIESDHRRDSDVRILFSVNNSTEVDLSLMGSGTLQIIEILLAAFSDSNYDLGIILLDEPDSHIHRDIQKRLLQVLLNSEKKQVFATTHNESFIRSTSSKNLFHLDGQPENEYYPIIKTNFEYPKIGLMPSKQMKILENLGYENALDFLNALEADKLILVEGDDDARYIQAICDANNIQKNLMFWSFRGVTNIFKNLKGYQAVFENIKNKRTLWEKSMLVFDSDFINEEQIVQIEKSFKEKLKIETYIWPSYTIESTVLREPEKLSRIILRILEQRNIQVDQHSVQNTLTMEIDGFKNAVELKLNNISQYSEYFDKINNQIRDRRTHLEHNYDIKILPKDDKILMEFDKKKNQLSANDVSGYANKNDVFKIISTVIARYDSNNPLKADSIDDKDIEDLMLLIIQTSGLSLFESWGRLIQMIKK